jgi:hypothetical protein
VAVGVALGIGRADAVGRGVRGAALGAATSVSTGCATAGCSGAAGFFGWASTYVVDPRNESPETRTARIRSAQAGI